MSKTRQVSLLLSVMFTSILFAGFEIKDAELNLPPELVRVLRDYESAWLKQDAAGLAKLFTEDGFVLSGGKPPVRGSANIADHYQSSDGKLTLTALHFEIDDRLGFIIGSYTYENGRWLIVSDMDNSNAYLL